MALKATIYKADIDISDMDRGYYASHNLTLACHPSETVERMMLRMVAFILNASETLAFTKDICADDEPALWQKNYSDEIELWIDLGEPDEKRIKKACSRAEQVIVYSHGGRASDVWWQAMETKVSRFDNLSVVGIGPETLSELAAMAERSMQFSATLQDGQLWLSDGTHNVLIEGVRLKSAAHA